MHRHTLTLMAAIGAAFGLAACGGPKTEDGVKYDKKAAADIVDVCRSRIPMMLSPMGMRDDVLKPRDQKSIARKCCAEIKRPASKLNDLQRAFLWYDWQGLDDINQTPNQIAALRTVEDAISRDLTSVQRTAASALKLDATLCSTREAQARTGRR